MRIVVLSLLVLFCLPLVQGCSSQLAEEEAVVEQEDETGVNENKE